MPAATAAGKPDPQASVANGGTSAASSAKLAPTHLAHSSAVEVAVPGNFCAELWQSVEGIFSATLAHPFLAGLVDGSLDEAAFKRYVVQDALYLREYGRALALLGSRAPRADWTAFFCRCSQDTYEVEGGFHKEFLSHFSTTVEAETAVATRHPSSLLYTSFVLATVHERAFCEGLAAVLPCFLVYLEVGKALKPRGSPHPLYASWLEKYGGQEFERIVMEVVCIVNEVAAEVGEAQRQRMQKLFAQGCRMEYLFWDAAYTHQQWPV